VSGIAEDDRHNLWLGTEGGGLNYFDRQKDIFRVYKNIPDDPSSLGSNLVKVIYRDSRGDIWVGTHGGGLNLISPNQDRFIRYLYDPGLSATFNSEINAVLEDSQGILWVGYQGALKFFRRTAVGYAPCPDLVQCPPSGTIKSLMEDTHHNIWIGKSSGLYLFRPPTGRITLMSPANINCLKEDREGRIWAGLYFGGLGMYDPVTEKWTYYTTANGLPNNNVIGILEDDEHNLWLSTDNGLSRFDVGRKRFKNYTQSDGLAANEFNYNSFYKSSQGELFFGGYNGITAFYPAQIETNNQTDPLVLTSLKLFNDDVAVDGKDGLLNEDIAYTKGLTLHYKQNVFTIEFALLNFIKSDKNKYAYRLDGFEKEWHYSANPSANYMNLPPGNYTFWVRGANNDGIWSPPVALRISILPPFWQTWWAYLLYGLFIGSIIFGVTRFFVLRALLRKDQALNQAKLNFFTNISHEIRTRLTLVSGPVEKLILGEKDESLLRQQLRSVKSNTDRLLKLVEELMDFRKAESRHLKLHISRQNLVPFVRDIYASFGDLARSRFIRTDFLSAAEDIPVYLDPVQMEKVFSNLLSNAFKFTPDGGYISITIEPQKDHVEVRVTDNGKGIAPENIPKLFDNYFQVNDQDTQNTGYGIGLALSKSIVQLHKGRLTVTSDLAAQDPAANRTCFSVILLGGSGHFHKEMRTAGGMLTAEGMFTAEEKWLSEGRFAVGERFAAGAKSRGSEAGARADSVSSEAGAAPAATGMRLAADGPARSGDRPRGVRPTLLLVEDNAEVRTFIRQSLAGAYHLLESPDGLSGWETATGQIPDLIVSDVMMPGMDGIALCRKLKEDQRTNHIPVILLTAKAAMENQISGLEMGADTYLTKPFSIQVLELHIRNLLAAAATMRQKFGRQLVLQSPGPDASAVQDEFLQKLAGIIEENMDNSDFDIPMLCTKIAMSQFVLYKKIKATTDMSVGDFIKQIRLQKAAQLLEQKQLNVNEVAYTVGFSDSKYFSKEFKKRFGVTPREYGKDGD
jgi:signal transduction histidine kinase/AraC-like DNA-binding protein